MSIPKSIDGGRGNHGRRDQIRLPLLDHQAGKVVDEERALGAFLSSHQLADGLLLGTVRQNELVQIRLPDDGSQTANPLFRSRVIDFAEKSATIIA